MTAVLGAMGSGNGGLSSTFPFGASVSMSMPDLDTLRGISDSGQEPLGPRELQRIKERQQAESKERQAPRQHPSWRAAHHH